jgi:cytochrome c oxidase assembly protein subunit 15
MGSEERGFVRNGKLVGVYLCVRRVAGEMKAGKMKATYHAFTYKFAVFVVGWTVFLLVAGALVTSKDAALSVPDWPTSFGTWFPSLAMLSGGAFFEHSHRVVAGVLGVFILILAVLLWKDERPRVRWMGIAAIFLVILQGILGGLTVIELLHFWLPVMHACLAQIMFGILVGIALVTSKWWMEEQPQYEDSGAPSIHTAVMLNALVIFVQVAMGAAFRHQYTSVRPHIYGSFLVLAVVIWTAALLRKRFSEVPSLTKVRIALHGIVGLQILLGIGALWTRIATVNAPRTMMIWFTVTHTVVGALLFATSVVAVLLCYRLVPTEREEIFATTVVEEVVA